MRSRTVASMILALLLGVVLGGASEPLGRDQELLNQGKVLMFDRKWDEARLVFQQLVQQHPSSAFAPQAVYFQARCLQFQGKAENALQGYEAFLQKYPGDPVLTGEARSSMVELAALLFERGNLAYRDRLVKALSDPNKDVRYFAAIRVAGLKDRYLDSMAMPVLGDIVKRESERELVDRARIALLRISPRALETRVEETPKAVERRREHPTPKPASASESRMFHVRVYKDGMSEPAVELNLPLSLAELAVAALDESAKAEIRRKGFDLDNVWESLKRLGPTNILTIRDQGSTIKLWIE
jgi:tetratricopeptide (TPR) repeat protein